MPTQKLSVQNNGWTKKAKIFRRNSRDFPNITLAGLESAIVTKRHLVHIDFCSNFHNSCLIAFIVSKSCEWNRIAKGKISFLGNFDLQSQF